MLTCFFSSLRRYKWSNVKTRHLTYNPPASTANRPSNVQIGSTFRK